MNNYSLTLQDLQKRFGRRLIFSNLSETYDKPGIYGISGPNGSGKSTLVKIIASLVTPEKGKVVHSSNGSVIPSEQLHHYLGFVSPYLVLYDEFTALENMEYINGIRGAQPDNERLIGLFEYFTLHNRRNDYVKGYSSGMKQRLKLIFSLAHNPSVVILDEPVSNLDEEGKEKVYDLIRRESSERIFLVASNEKTDLALCSRVLNIQDFKKKKKQ